MYLRTILLHTTRPSDAYYFFLNLITAIGCLTNDTLKPSQKQRVRRKIWRTRVNEEKKHSPEMREVGGREALCMCFPGYD
jgi:hypothetical protein